MQKKIAFFFILWTLTQFSCIKQENGQFQREYQMAIEIPANASPLATHQFFQNVRSSWTQFLSDNHLQQKDIRLVRPRSIVLTPVFDNPISYDLISDAILYIYPLTTPSQILPIATVTDPLGSKTELPFLPGLADVKDVVSLPEFTLRLDMHIRVTPGIVSDHHLAVRFDIFLN
jgi:hypothetical protein